MCDMYLDHYFNFVMEFIPTGRGGFYIAFEKYLFKKDKTNINGTVAYKCIDKNCQSRG